MTDNKKPQEEKYEGASNSTIALGQGSAYGWIGKGIGAVVGGTAASLLPNGRELIGKALKSLDKVKDKAVGGFAVGGGIILGSIIGHYIGLYLGVKHGMGDAGKGRKQFDRIKSERDQARQELSALKSELSVLAQDNPQLQSEQHAEQAKSRMQQGGHASALQADQSTQAELAR